MSGLFRWVTERLTEPSTWRGLTLLGTAAGVYVSPQMIETMVAVGGGIYSMILLVKKDSSKF